MSVKCVSWVGIILLFLTLANKLHGATVDSKTSEQLLKAIPFNILSFLSEPKYSVQVKSLNETLASCPNLWTQTEKEFIEKEETGILGSVTKLQELCPDKENLTLVCNGAIWISGYVCTASQNDQHQLPAVHDLKNLTDVSGLCQALVGNVSLTQKLCDIVETSVKSSEALNTLPLKEKLEKGCTLLSNGSQEHCNEYCGENKKPLCKIILQSLRTIVSLEEKKQNLLADNGANADTDLPTVNTTTFVLNPISSTDLPTTKPIDIVQQNTTEPHPQDHSFRNTKGTLNNTTQSTNLSVVIPMKTNDEKSALPLYSNASTQPSNKTSIKFPSTVATDFDTSSATEATVTDEDFGIDDFGSADKPSIKSAEDSPTYEDGDELVKEEKELNKEDIVPMEIQNAVHTDGSSEMDVDPINTHFLFYFIAFVVLSASGYLMFMRRKYLIALVLEGRFSSNRRRGNSFRERSSSGSYRKLVNNLEEAIISNSVKNSNVIY